MSKKDVIDAIEVKTPCGESWHEMQGNEKVRFCSHCSKDVNNISEMTRKEALRLVRRSEGRLCIRYIKDPKTGRPLFSENLHKITRRATGLAAGVMTATISLSTAAYAQGGMRAPRPETDARQNVNADREKPDRQAEARSTGKISGTVTDSLGAVVVGTEVSLFDEKTGTKTQTTTANGEGIYQFEGIPEGFYKLEFTSPGLRNILLPRLRSPVTVLRNARAS